MNILKKTIYKIEMNALGSIHVCTRNYISTLVVWDVWGFTFNLLTLTSCLPHLFERHRRHMSTVLTSETLYLNEPLQLNVTWVLVLWHSPRWTYNQLILISSAGKAMKLKSRGRAIAQAVSRWLPIAAARVRARVWSCGICGGQSVAGAGFLRVLRFPLPIFISPVAPQSSWGLYNRPEVAAVPRDLVQPH
jgi:hypothetical protein